MFASTMLRLSAMTGRKACVSLCQVWGLCQSVSEPIKGQILCQAVSGRTGPCQGSGRLLKARCSPRPALWERFWRAVGTPGRGHAIRVRVKAVGVMCVVVSLCLSAEWYGNVSPCTAIPAGLARVGLGLGSASGLRLARCELCSRTWISGSGETVRVCSSGVRCSHGAGGVRGLRCPTPSVCAASGSPGACCCTRTAYPPCLM